MIAAQVALYPLGDVHVDAVVTAALGTINEAGTLTEADGLDVDVSAMSTVITGRDDLVWAAVRRLFDAAADGGHRVVLTATVSNECGCDTYRPSTP